MKRINLLLAYAIFVSNVMAIKPEKIIDFSELNPNKNKTDLDENKKISNVAKTGAKIGVKMLGAYGYCFASTAAHELGHAIPQKIFHGLPIQITIGSGSPGQRIVTINGFNPLNGFINQFKESDWSENVISAASGPLAGLAFNVATLKAINVADEYKKDKRSVSDAIRKGLTKPLFSQKNPWANTFCYINMINHLVRFLPLNFRPFNMETDGDYIANSSGLNSRLTSALITSASVAGIVYLTKKYYESIYPKKTVSKESESVYNAS